MAHSKAPHSESQEKLASLRARHPRLIYRSHSFQAKSNAVEIEFDLLLEPDIEFRPRLSLPLLEKPTLTSEYLALLERLVFNLGMVECISYWKTACPKELVVLAGALDEKAKDWWQDLFIHGLGEFFFCNQIDFAGPDFFSIENSGQRAENFNPRHLTPTTRDELILVGGGKDSVVSLELLKNPRREQAVFVLNPIQAAINTSRQAGYQTGLEATRTIDSKLLRLNTEGYFNGHTPFSAYLAFLGSAVAVLNGYKSVIASNERSANEANTYMHGTPINHQYSKSFRFEKRFREYSANYLSTTSSYFSFLRPLYDLQISAIFSSYREQLPIFRSCNVYQREDSWCCQCPKCAFVYLCLSPFLDQETLQAVFGCDVFANAKAREHTLALLGLGAKPFECVGTRAECIVAAQLIVEKQKSERICSADFLATALGRLCDLSEEIPKPNDLLSSWNEVHALSPEFEQCLRNAVESEIRLGLKNV